MKYLKLFIPVIFAVFATIFIHAPAFFMQSFLDGVTVWAYNVLPALFPFAVLTPLALKFLPTNKKSICGKLFGIPTDAIYISSLLCGYPIGAKLIAESNLSCDEATQASAFCSSASPIFVTVTVGTKLIGNTAATAVLLVSHFLSTIFCGLFLRKKRTESLITDNDCRFSFGDLGDALTASTLSVLTVCGLIALFFMLSDMIKSLLPASVSQSVAVGFLFGIFEMTNGIISVCAASDTLCATVLSSFLLGFGGLCVFCQSMTFLSKKNVSPTKYLYQKAIQGSLASLLAFVFGKIALL